MSTYDLLSMIDQGGCSAKLSALELERVLSDLPKTPDKNLLVGIDTHDDAGVYKINDELALIQTTDFFPPVCSDPYEFGQIAAANALSDVYAMGGQVLTVLNLIMFPAQAPLQALKEILRGGAEKVIEAGGVVMGGHTIVDDIPKYGLAVTGTVHPQKIITNALAKSGDQLILTKPLGCGVVIAGKRLGEVSEENYTALLNSMKHLNKAGAAVMQEFDVRSATDITGYGLSGHALKMALASNVTIRIIAKHVPTFEGVRELLDLGCIPGACFRNLDYTGNNCKFEPSLTYEQKMLMMDAQTSGGLLICCPPELTDKMLAHLYKEGYLDASLIGEVQEKGDKALIIS
jgi:selenide, water dikinase